MKRVCSREGDTLDLICHREYGRTRSVTEIVLEANPMLATGLLVLPIGTLVTLPDIASEDKSLTQKRLW